MSDPKNSHYVVRLEIKQGVSEVKVLSWQF